MKIWIGFWAELELNGVCYRNWIGVKVLINKLLQIKRRNWNAKTSILLPTLLGWEPVRSELIFRLSDFDKINLINLD